MTWHDVPHEPATQPMSHEDIAARVMGCLAGQVTALQVDEIAGFLVLVGEATSYHAKQLAQQQVMELSNCPIRRNRIRVTA
jgi:hypothetical protein